jgi:hypothetical protein
LLLVQGFDRLERTVKAPDNRFHYLGYHAQAIAGIADYAVAFDSCSNEVITAGRVRLADYRAVDWASGEESTAHETYSSAEQALVGSYLSAGGRLFASGAEIGWDLVAKGSSADRAFYENQLGTLYVNDDATVYRAGPLAGSIYVGLPDLSFDDGTGPTYDVDYPDSIAPNGSSSKASLAYRGTAFTAGIERIVGNRRVVNWGFPFETITDAGLRQSYMDRTVEFLLAPRTLASDRHTTVPGGRVALSVDLPAKAGHIYVLGAAGSSQPGVSLGGGRVLPLALDPLFFLSLGSVTGVFQNFAGFLDGSGRAAAAIDVPNLPELRGLVLFVSGLTLDAMLQPDEVLPWLRVRVQ